MLHDTDLICEGVVRALKSAPQAATPAASADTEAARTGAAAAPTGDAGVPLGVVDAPAGEASALQEATSGQVCTGHPVWTLLRACCVIALCRSCCQVPSQAGARPWDS